MSKKDVAARVYAATLIAVLILAASAAAAADLKSLTVCADPGNMPLSNQKGEGFENKIAELIGASLGTGVHYYWRPSIERGLMRTTLSEGNCDLWMDMASDTEGAVVLAPLYRSTFVLAYRNDKHIEIKTLDDPILKKLRIGVFQVSAIRQALSEHRIVDNTVIHYLSHNADIVPENQPSFQVQRVIDGTLDIAAAWGPMAGYYRKVLGAPLTILPVNLLEDEVPMEFDMTLAVPRGRPDIKAAIEQALVTHKQEIHRILSDFGVPLVACDACTVSGDLPSHGPYKPVVQPVKTAAEIAGEHAEKLAALKKWLAQGANPDEELHNAITANDVDRVRYLLSLGSKDGAHVNARDGEGNTPLINATRFGFVAVATFLAEHGADAKMTDRSGWTALMFAAWGNNAAMVTMLAAHGAKLESGDGAGIAPLALAAQNGRLKSAQALIAAGADVNAPVAKGGYTPLMLAALSGSSDLVAMLIERGARVNATNPGGVSALMIATANNRSQVAALLLKAGADVNLKSEDGRTAIGIAKTNGNDALVRLLEEAAQKGAAKSG
jgi:quinoprotein dehydrogenase-associated probable ABC transporter substrate-binding protein